MLRVHTSNSALVNYCNRQSSYEIALSLTNVISKVLPPITARNLATKLKIQTTKRLLASERSERAQSCSCSIEISDTYVYICIYICGRTSSYMRMLGGM